MSFMVGTCWQVRNIVFLDGTPQRLPKVTGFPIFSPESHAHRMVKGFAFASICRFQDSSVQEIGRKKL